MFARALNDSDRTNNFAEACHKRGQLMFGSVHPVICQLIRGLKLSQKEFDNEYERFVAGYDARRKRPDYELADARILNIVFNYDRVNILEYLRGLSQNYKME